MNQVDRRKFIQYSSMAGIGAFALTMTPSKLLANSVDKSPIMHYTTLQSHLINRTSFGINEESKESYQQLGYRDFIEYQLNHEDIDDSEIEDYIAQSLPTVNMGMTEIRQLIQDSGLTPFRVADELNAATFLRATYSKKQLFEVMVEFWNNHFSVFHFDGPIPMLKSLEDREVIRPNALSSFSNLLHADIKSPAMIYYLDTYSSTKEAPNENYARELMELHTLGVDGPYTHQDIDEVARCFTGWKINQRTGEFRFDIGNHDFDEKTVLGQTIAAGGGITDGEQVVDILLSDPSTAKFISQKLCRHFISDNPDKSIVDSTTEMFISSNGDIKEILRHILLSKHFMISKDMKLKRPFNFLTAAVRSLKGDTLNINALRQTKRLLQALGHAPFNWPSPDGYPDVAKFWESTSGMLFRWNFASTFSFGEFSGYSYNLSELFEQPYSPENIYAQIAEKIIHRDMASVDEQALMQYLIDGSSNNIVSNEKIQGALAIALSSPYFQLS